MTYFYTIYTSNIIDAFIFCFIIIDIYGVLIMNMYSSNRNLVINLIPNYLKARSNKPKREINNL